MWCSISIPVAFPSAILATKTRQKNNKSASSRGKQTKGPFVLDCFFIVFFGRKLHTDLGGVFLDIRDFLQANKELLCHGSRLSERRETSCGMLSRKSMFFFVFFEWLLYIYTHFSRYIYIFFTYCILYTWNKKNLMKIGLLPQKEMSSSKCNFWGTFAASLRMYASVLGFLKGSFLFVLQGDDSLNFSQNLFF